MIWVRIFNFNISWLKVVSNVFLNSSCVSNFFRLYFVGHGPFSHLWEGFVHEAEPDCKWHHEDNSISKYFCHIPTRSRLCFCRKPIMLDSLIGSFGYLEMLDYLIEDNNLKDVLRQEGISDKDILFIKEMIAGPMSSKTGNQCCKLLSTFHSSLDGESISLIWIVYNI